MKVCIPGHSLNFKFSQHHCKLFLRCHLRDYNFFDVQSINFLQLYSSSMCNKSILPKHHQHGESKKLSINSSSLKFLRIYRLEGTNKNHANFEYGSDLICRHMRKSQKILCKKKLIKWRRWHIPH